MNRYKTFLVFVCFFAFLQNIISQTRQTNTSASEIFADAPYLCQKFDLQGNQQGIPITIICHDASSSGVDLKSIDISIKDISQTTFGNSLKFSNMSDIDFYKQFKIKSKTNSNLGIQKMDTATVFKDNSVSLKFSTASNDFEEIRGTWWYFVFEIPASYLQSYSDTIDIKVYFSEDWSTDDAVYLRVVRSTDTPVKLTNWYRGDTHVHSSFTQNNVELGFPTEVTTYMAEQMNLDWVSFTDHSCDFDNYGINMKSNWNELGTNIQLNNNTNQNLKLIRGIEMSVDNSKGDIVHTLVYPSPQNPYSLAYIGDGGGDISGTDVNIDMMLDSCIKYDAFGYAAHPFATGDILSSSIGGGIWNIGHNGFKQNGAAYNYAGTVSCNYLSSPSDIYSTKSGEYFKKGLIGGQLLNWRNKLSVADDYNNPWNAANENLDAFALIDTLDDLQYQKRYQQGREAFFFILQQALKDAQTNALDSVTKFFQLAGSDAHGSYNYSNTDYTFGYVGAVTDNTLGKFSTLAYCPDGMGQNAENILRALRKGKVIISDGPIVSFELQNSLGAKATIGDEIHINDLDLESWNINNNVITNETFGTIKSLRFIIGFKNNIYYYNYSSTSANLSLYTILYSIFGDNIPNERFFIIAELYTHKNSNSSTFNGDFFSATNPIWIKINHENLIVDALASNNSLCIGETSQLNSNINSSGTCSYSWLPANGLSSTSIANPIASPTTTTTYTVTASYLSQTATNSVVITVNPIPSITFTPSVTSICVGQSANILVSGASSYSWSPALGLNQTIGNSIIASPSSNITYTVTGTSNGCSASASTVVNVNALPVVSTNAASVAICAGQSTLLSATGASSYSWSPALGLNQTTGNYIVSTPSANTTYTVTGTSNTCSASSSIIVYVNPIPSISVNPTTSSICNGESISLSANGANSYVWSPSNGLNQSAGNSIIASPSSNTTYTVTGTSNACSASQNVYVFVNPIPNSSFSLSKANDICTNEAITITYTGTINPFSVYSWNFDNAYLLSGNISSAGPFLIKWNVEGNHTISLSERLNNCQSDTFTINAFVEVCTNIELLKTDDINVFPSPATNFITIEGIKPNSTIRISDLTGRTIYFKDNYNTNTLNIEVSSFANGNYCLIIQGSNYSVYKTFVKNKE